MKIKEKALSEAIKVLEDSNNLNSRFDSNSLVLTPKRDVVLNITEKVKGTLESVVVNLGAPGVAVQPIEGKVFGLRHRDMIAILDAVDKEKNISFVGDIAYSFPVKHVAVKTLPKEIWPNMSKFEISDGGDILLRSGASFYDRPIYKKSEKDEDNYKIRAKDIDRISSWLTPFSLRIKTLERFPFVDDGLDHEGRFELKRCPNFEEIEELALVVSPERPVVNITISDLKKSQIKKINQVQYSRVPVYDCRVFYLDLKVPEKDGKIAYSITKKTDICDDYFFIGMHPPLEKTIPPMEKHFGKRLEVL